MLCMRPAPQSRKAFLPGGGVALLRAGKAIKKIRAKTRTSRTATRRRKGDHLAGAPDRNQRRRGWLGRGRQDPGARYLRLRLRRADRRVRQPGVQGHHRPPRSCASRCRTLPRCGLLITPEAMVAELPKRESGDAGRRRHWWNGRDGLSIALFIFEDRRPGDARAFENLTYKPLILPARTGDVADQQQLQTRQRTDQIINTPPATLIDQPTMLMRRGVTRGPLSQRKGDFMGAIMGRN